MSARAGVLITGTEVLTGIIADRNGPWLADRLREQGFDLAHIAVVGDRPGDIEAALRFFAAQGVDLVVTSGGLGPTADDLTAEVVGRCQGRPMLLDEALEGRIAAILARLAARWHGLDEAAIRAGNRKQAMVPQGATILEPVGTAPGLVVPPAESPGPTVVVLPGPPRELQPMWGMAVATEAFRATLERARTYRRGMLRLFGIPESEIAETLRVFQTAAEAGGQGLDLSALEITTCLRRGEIEIATLYAPEAEAAYEAFADAIRRRHRATLFSDDGSTVDDQVAALLAGRRLAVAESCTGGLLAGRLTARPGSSEYFVGGLVVYANQAKRDLAGVPEELLARYGAVSPQAAEALAAGAIERLGADVGIGVTGIAGPGGGSPDKPVGRVCLSARLADGVRLTRSLDLPGGREDVRERSTTVALHLLRRLLLAPAPVVAEAQDG